MLAVRRLRYLDCVLICHIIVTPSVHPKTNNKSQQSINPSSLRYNLYMLLKKLINLGVVWPLFLALYNLANSSQLNPFYCHVSAPLFLIL